MATHRGSSPTRISAIFVFRSPPTSSTETELLSGLTTQTKRSSWVMAIGLEEVGNRSLWGASPEGVSTQRVPTSAATMTPDSADLLAFLIGPSSFLQLTGSLS